MLRQIFITLSLVVSLAGCATPGRDARLLPGTTSSAEILSHYGPPSRIWPEVDGGKTLEYSSQPFGQTCYMIRFGPDDRLISIEDTLQYPGRSSIVAGMTPEQVSRRLGKERSRMFFHLSGEDVWDWNIEPDHTGYRLRFNVHFKDGVVVRTGQSMVFPERLGRY